MTCFPFRRRVLARALVLCLALPIGSAACSDSTGPLPREGPPDELRFDWGGFAIDAITVELQDDAVLMWRRTWDWTGETIDTLRVVPTPEQWREFWIAADRAGVRRWRSRYAAEGVVDGVGWSLRLVAGDFALESMGANAYPDAVGREHELEMTPAFRSLRDALGDLVGEPL